MSQMVGNLSLSHVRMPDSPDVTETVTATLGGVGQDAGIDFGSFLLGPSFFGKNTIRPQTGTGTKHQMNSELYTCSVR